MLAPMVLSLVLAYAAVPVPANSQAAGGQQPPATGQETTPEKPWPPAGVFKSGAGVSSPRLIRETKPKYTPEAMRNRIEGIVEMQVIIERTGRVGAVRVTRSLDRDFGLDDQAIQAVRQWRFEPGQKDGVAVPVLVSIEMTFALRK